MESSSNEQFTEVENNDRWIDEYLEKAEALWAR
jgi:hypothetical protein